MNKYKNIYIIHLIFLNIDTFYMRNTINIYNTYLVFTLLLLQFINITNTCICNITFIQFIIIYSVTNIIYMSLVAF